MAQLDESLSYVRDRVADCTRAGRSVRVTTHTDCDGIAAGAIITKALSRRGTRYATRTADEFSGGLIASLKSDPRDLHIITDLGGGFAAELDRELGDSWIILDHHQIPDGEADNERVVNAWRFGIDGGTEVCGGGMAYLAARAMDDANTDLAGAAVVAALGDRQDAGERRSLTGKNHEIAEEARGAGLLESGLDLLLVGRETRPLADALAFTSQPFIEGLTWNRDACAAALESAGVSLKEGGRWRVPAELDQDEKGRVMEEVARSAGGGAAATAGMIGYAYTFPGEDGRGFLRDGREFATMLNSCGRAKRAGAGMAVCMGERGDMLREAEGVLARYRTEIREYMEMLGGQRWRFAEGERHVVVNGQDVIPESMTGTISSLMAGSPRNAGKVVILHTRAEENAVKFSSRKAPGCSPGINLSRIMRSGAEKFDGIGGGHDAAAGAKVSRERLDEFLKYLDASVQDTAGS
ncbi:MAG: DHH family phosphoesterase [Nitrosopumilus sp.]|nr:DHH family phosphoesterase [Nitrosopumilus sp.]MDA7958756.1 DHH family phosphoesterase [Nitrosopumilus sp.]